MFIRSRSCGRGRRTSSAAGEGPRPARSSRAGRGKRRRTTACATRGAPCAYRSAAPLCVLRTIWVLLPCTPSLRDSRLLVLLELLRLCRGKEADRDEVERADPA